MSRAIVLDSGPLGLISNPRSSPKNDACAAWFQQLLAASVTVVIPEIVDYELRSELLRANKSKGLQRLDALLATAYYLPITTSSMRRAAEIWAEARRTGKQTAANAALDIDVILAAQVATCEWDDAIIATTNVRHLTRYVPTKEWPDVTPDGHA